MVEIPHMHLYSLKEFQNLKHLRNVKLKVFFYMLWIKISVCTILKVYKKKISHSNQQLNIFSIRYKHYFAPIRSIYI